ncbi:hypothetical protein [Pseudoalteromonas sp. S16_S37]|uniref:hypothetical protein n=1 Tax=Pseudoalteromonas sp. S16_S37 TaxID=2720228 RepID=UPI00168094D2|nr:hypothetical protein [Pseudoalteromonas sp. S16_S37]MBD1584002.1 hypothetical protein [Pseudoalteromonas sp. S16_S37]
MKFNLSKLGIFFLVTVTLSSASAIANNLYESDSKLSRELDPIGWTHKLTF